MTLDALTTAGTLAVFAAALFLITARVWQAVSHIATGASVFRDSTMREAAQHLRDETERLRRNQASYLAALLVFGLIFVLAIKLDIGSLYRNYPQWQLTLIAVLLASASAFVFYKIVATLIRLARARFARDASIAIGHELLRLASTQGSVFHDVEIGGARVDHVLIGHNGAYAIHVLARKNRRNHSARLVDERVELGPDDSEGLEALTNRVHKLSAAFSNLASHKIKVRSVVAVPGWDVEDQQGDRHLLVNERTLPMLTGWKSQSDYLMNEDVAAIQNYLTECSKR